MTDATEFSKRASFPSVTQPSSYRPSARRASAFQPSVTEPTFTSHPQYARTGNQGGQRLSTLRGYPLTSLYVNSPRLIRIFQYVLSEPSSQRPRNSPTMPFIMDEGHPGPYPVNPDLGTARSPAQRRLTPGVGRPVPGATTAPAYSPVAPPTVPGRGAGPTPLANSGRHGLYLEQARTPAPASGLSPSAAGMHPALHAAHHLRMALDYQVQSLQQLNGELIELQKTHPAMQTRLASMANVLQRATQTANDQTALAQQYLSQDAQQFRFVFGERAPAPYMVPQNNPMPPMPPHHPRRY